MSNEVPRRDFLLAVSGAAAFPKEPMRTLPAEGDRVLADSANTIPALILGVLSFGTMSQFVASFIPDATRSVQLCGFYAEDDCPTFKLYRLQSAPRLAKPWHKQTADGGWWAYSNAPDLDIRMFGARGSILPSDASINREAIQNAIDFKYSKGGGVVHAAGFFFVDDTIYRPMSVRIQGVGRHSVLREYGDKTAGIDHPNTGTVFHTAGPGKPRLWTDESGDGADELLRPLIAELGENGGISDITLQTTRDENSWDIGVLICGVSRGRYLGLDIRGAWRKAACRMDATWGRNNPRLMNLRHLPEWFSKEYAILYDYGLTNNLFDFCRFEGATAFQVESGPNEAYAGNGISDSKLRACEFYNDSSAETLSYRETDGALIGLNYRLPRLGGAQGLSFESCRFDCACIWVFDIGYWSNLDVVDGREFAETSIAWYNYQDGKTGAAAVPNDRKRGRIRTSEKTTLNRGDMLRFDGEFFCNISANAPDHNGDVRPRNWVPRGEQGKRIEFKGPNINNTMDFLSDGEFGANGLTLRSWRKDGRIGLQRVTEGAVDTWGYLALNAIEWGTAYAMNWGLGTVALKRDAVDFITFDGADVRLPIIRTTANAANLNYDAATGRVRLSTSGEQYKIDIEPADFSLSKKIVLGSRPAWYRSNADGDNSKHSFWGFIANEIAEIDPRMVHWRTGKIIRHRFIDIVLNGQDEPIWSWPARYDDEDEAKTLRIEIDEGRWVPFSEKDDPLLASKMGYYQTRVESEFVSFEEPIPDGVQYERYTVHLVSVVQKLWSDLKELRSELNALKAAVPANEV
ncbi:hypothetical protein KX729_18995 [Rhizobium sp. XQZ8]|uniref:hypothetical protein n=1 Tax=Rhizobium populisoli TaxID=2859785 RepID=UPI001CA5434A|nr:hypothetical protein [Rhizobium populisoli]MBW6423548.1 hypothetical protein [Rhizobium populisoli]